MCSAIPFLIPQPSKDTVDPDGAGAFTRTAWAAAIYKDRMGVELEWDEDEGEPSSSIGDKSSLPEIRRRGGGGGGGEKSPLRSPRGGWKKSGVDHPFIRRDLDKVDELRKGNVDGLSPTRQERERAMTDALKFLWRDDGKQDKAEEDAAAPFRMISDRIEDIQAGRVKSSNGSKTSSSEGWASSQSKGSSSAGKALTSSDGGS